VEARILLTLLSTTGRDQASRATQQFARSDPRDYWSQRRHSYQFAPRHWRPSSKAKPNATTQFVLDTGHETGVRLMQGIWTFGQTTSSVPVPGKMVTRNPASKMINKQQHLTSTATILFSAAAGTQIRTGSRFLITAGRRHAHQKRRVQMASSLGT